MALIEAASAENVKELYLIVSVYAPNCHRVSCSFFQELFDDIEAFGTEAATNESESFEIIIAGDFNCVLNPVLDSANRHITTAEQRLSNVIRGELESR